MGKKAYVFSTLANDQKYINWVPGGGDVSVPGRAILIKGGAGIANDRFVTPLGVMTEVEEDEICELEANPGFQQHVKNGFITVQKRSADAEKVAADMNRSDPSAPKTPSDYSGDGSNDLEAKPKD